MSQKYPTRKIEEICEDIYDGPHATPDKIDQGPIFLGVSNLVNGRLDLSDTDHVSREDFKEWTRRVTPKQNDLVFSYETRLGEAALIPDDLECCLGRRMGLIRPKRDVIHPRYLLYAWLSPEFQRTIQANASQGSTVNRILLTELGDYPIRVPSLPIQRRIADILGALDDKIALNRQMNETLEAMAQALYRHWFVDFGPFQDQPFVDSELGPIPEGWDVGRLGDYCTINRETVDKDNPPDPIQYIKISGVNRGRVEEIETIPYKDAPSRAKRRVQDGDVVWSKVRPNRASYFLCLEPHNDLVVSTGFATITPDHLPFSFVYAALTTDDFVEYLTVRATGAAYPSVRLDAFKDAQFVIPDDEVLGRFHDKTEPLYRLQRSNEKENQTLAETRDYLLPKLISGEIEVEAAEERVESAAA